MRPRLSRRDLRPCADDHETNEAQRLGGIGGAGGNSTIIVGKTSVIVVDAKQTEAGAKDLLAEIAKITPKPVTTVLITHSDGDHVNGLVAFPAGTKIIAHENNKKEQETALAAGGRGAPPPKAAEPGGTKTKEAITIDGVKLELYHLRRRIRAEI